jgi:hypothetical protein
MRFLYLSPLLFMMGHPAASQVTAYVPVFNAPAPTRSTGTSLPAFTGWYSLVQAYNTGGTTGYVRTVDRFPSVGPGPCLSDPVLVLPHNAEYYLGNCGGAQGGLAFIKVEVSSGMVLGAHVAKVDGLYGCGFGFQQFVIEQGRAPLPVFSSLFPAGATTIAGDVGLGSSWTCAAAIGEDYRRRVNLTILNAGEEEAAVFVRVLPIRPSAPLLEISYLIPVRQVQQFRLPIPDFPTGAAYENNAWVEVTSTQPYLSYVTTIFENGQPGSQPFEIFPSRLP